MPPDVPFANEISSEKKKIEGCENSVLLLPSWNLKANKER